MDNFLHPKIQYNELNLDTSQGECKEVIHEGTKLFTILDTITSKKVDKAKRT